MAIYELNSKTITKLNETSFSANAIRERDDLQRILRDNIEVISPGTLIIAEEFGQWEDSRRRIDLLGIDSEDARLVVIELKRTQDGGHMELQALRYAAMVSQMTFSQAVQIYSNYLPSSDGTNEDAEDLILKHLGWSEPNEELFAQGVRVVLASADFSKELTTTAMWLNENQLDVRCVRLKPYLLDRRVLLDVQQVVPLPEAADYQTRIAEKQRSERVSKRIVHGDGHKIADIAQQFVQSHIQSKTNRRTGKMVFFLPPNWDDKLPAIGDAWGKRVGRKTPLVFWINITMKNPGVKIVFELGKFPNYKLRQQIINNLRSAGFSIGKLGDRSDAKYTRVHTTWKRTPKASWEHISESEISELVASTWEEFSVKLDLLESICLDCDWSMAGIIPE